MKRLMTMDISMMKSRMNRVLMSNTMKEEDIDLAQNIV